MAMFEWTAAATFDVNRELYCSADLKDMMNNSLLKFEALTRSVRMFTTSGNRSLFGSLGKTPHRPLASRQQHSIRCYSNEMSGGHATHKPTPFQQKILVWGKMYPSVDKVPERVTRGQIKKAMDIFRVRSSICMAALVFVFAAIMAMIGRKQRMDGMTLTKITLERRQSEK